MAKCRYCEQPIEWRRVYDRPGGRYVAFDPDGEPHDCPNKREARRESTRAPSLRGVAGTLELYAGAARAEPEGE